MGIDKCGAAKPHENSSYSNVFTVSKKGREREGKKEKKRRDRYTSIQKFMMSYYTLVSVAQVLFDVRFVCVILSSSWLLSSVACFASAAVVAALVAVVVRQCNSPRDVVFVYIFNDNACSV